MKGIVKRKDMVNKPVKVTVSSTFTWRKGLGAYIYNDHGLGPGEQQHNNHQSLLYHI
jgi:peptidoglycan hydrolase-like amidase